MVLTSNVANPVLRLARLLPHPVRVLAKRHAAGAAERDVYPAVYRANTVPALAAAMAEAHFRPAELRTVATLHRYADARRSWPSSAPPRLSSRPSQPTARRRP